MFGTKSWRSASRIQKRNVVGGIIIAGGIAATFFHGTLAYAWTSGAWPFSFNSSGRLVAQEDSPDGSVDYLGNFPFGVYVRGGTGNDAFWRRYRAVRDSLGPAKIDLVTSGWGSGDAEMSQARQVINECKANGIKLFYDLYDGPDGMQQTEDPMYGHRNFHNNSALAGFIHADDSDILFPANGTAANGATISTLADNETAIRTLPAIDKATGTVTVNIETATMLTLSGAAVGDRNAIRPYTQWADIIAGQSYPITQSYRRPDNVWHRMRNLVQECQQSSRRPIPMGILQLEGPEGGLGFARPTPAELETMTYAAITAGVKGLFFYEFESDVQPAIDLSEPELWESLKRLSQEVDYIKYVLLYDQFTSFEPYPGEPWFYSTWETNTGAKLLIVVNADPNRVYRSNVRVSNVPQRPVASEMWDRTPDVDDLVPWNDSTSGWVYSDIPPMSYRMIWVQPPN